MNNPLIVSPIVQPLYEEDLLAKSKREGEKSIWVKVYTMAQILSSFDEKDHSKICAQYAFYIYESIESKTRAPRLEAWKDSIASRLLSAPWLQLIAFYNDEIVGTLFNQRVSANIELEDSSWDDLAEGKDDSSDFSHSYNSKGDKIINMSMNKKPIISSLGSDYVIKWYWQMMYRALSKLWWEVWAKKVEGYYRPTTIGPAKLKALASLKKREMTIDEFATKFDFGKYANQRFPQWHKFDGKLVDIWLSHLDSQWVTFRGVDQVSMFVSATFEEFEDYIPYTPWNSLTDYEILNHKELINYWSDNNPDWITAVSDKIGVTSLDDCSAIYEFGEVWYWFKIDDMYYYAESNMIGYNDL